MNFSVSKPYDGTDLTKKFYYEILRYDNVWAWIKARIKAVNFNGISICDYIPITINGQAINMQIAGIDTHYHTGDPLPLNHHIDFISRECYNQVVAWNTTNTNNGTENENSSYLSSNLCSWLNNIIYPLLPQELKNVISTKRTIVEHRFKSGENLLNSNTWYWKDLGHLWVPTEFEVFGCAIWGTHRWSVGQAIQYPIFMNDGFYHRVKNRAGTNFSCYWWLVTPQGDSDDRIVRVHGAGHVSTDIATKEIYSPICFRIAGE